MSAEALEKMQRARIKLLMKQPFWGMLALYLKLEEVPEIPTAGTDYEKLYYNPAFVNPLTDAQTMGLWIHEIDHIIFDHTGRLGTRDRAGWNIACVTGNTLVTMADGTRKPIVDVREGESVLGYDDGRLVPTTVLFKIERSTDEIVELYTPSKTLSSTIDHRIMTPHGFTEAVKLDKKELLSTVDHRRGNISPTELQEDDHNGHRQNPRTHIPQYRGTNPQEEVVEEQNDGMVVRLSRFDTAGRRMGVYSWYNRWRRDNNLTQTFGQRETVLPAENHGVEHKLCALPILEGTRVLGRHKEKFQRKLILAHNPTQSKSTSFHEGNRAILGDQKTTSGLTEGIHNVEDESEILRPSHGQNAGDIQGDFVVKQERISSKRRVRKSAKVYDLTTTTHTYIANDIIVHNCDYVINYDIRNSKTDAELPSGALYTDSAAGLTAEAMYDKLPKTTTKCPVCGGNLSKDGNGDTVCNRGGHNITQGPWDKHMQPKGGAGSKQAKQAAREWKNRAAQAAISAKSRGLLPAGLESLLGAVTEPQVSWRQVFAQYLVRLFKNSFKWTPPSRRHLHTGFILPSLKSEGLGDVVFAIDVSGSISDRECEVSLSEVQAALNTYDMNLHMIQHDAEVTDYQIYHRGDRLGQVKIKGRGGTDHVPVFKWAKDRTEDGTLVDGPMIMVCLTDAYSAYPDDEPDFPVLWVLSPDHGETPKWGDKIILDQYESKE